MFQYFERIFHRFSSGQKKCRNVLLVDEHHLKVGDFGLSKLIHSKSVHDVYKLTGETGSCKLCDTYYAILNYFDVLTSISLFRSVHGSRGL